MIALIGIANTLALSVHERRRELGLLRAVGMTRPQVRSAIRWESVMIALMGTFLGFALAVAGSWGIISAIKGDSPISLVVPPVQLTVIVVLASVAGVQDLLPFEAIAFTPNPVLKGTVGPCEIRERKSALHTLGPSG